MVLEGATSAAPTDSFIEALPASDTDSYSSNSEFRQSTSVALPGTNNQIAIALQNVPDLYKPSGGLAKTVALNIQKQCTFAGEVLGRPTRQTETDAFAFHLSKRVATEFTSLPLGYSLGLAQCWRRRHDFRFPGYSPGPNFNPEKFGPLKGQVARGAWHALRSTLYGVSGLMVAYLFFSSYGMSVEVVGRATDPRLQDFNQELKKYVLSKRAAKESGIREIDTTPGQRAGETYQMARQRQSVQGRWGSDRQTEPLQEQEQDQQQQQQFDDMSPTGGSFKDEYWGSSAGTELMSDSQLQRQQQSASARASSSPSITPTNSDRGAQNRLRDSQETSKPASSWERLRQQAAASKSPGDRPTGVNTSDPSASRAQAQADFDARIAREREGGDFFGIDGGSGGSSSRGR